MDSIYWRRVGRRKSWIVPIQLLTAWMLFACAGLTQRLYEEVRMQGLQVRGRLLLQSHVTGHRVTMRHVLAMRHSSLARWAARRPRGPKPCRSCLAPVPLQAHVTALTGIFLVFVFLMATQVGARAAPISPAAPRAYVASRSPP